MFTLRLQSRMPSLQLTYFQLYLLGGLDDHDDPVHCVESYDPAYSEWMELQPLTSRRRLMAVASVGN